jgi:hypothetical protein
MWSASATQELRPSLLRRSRRDRRHGPATLARYWRPSWLWLLKGEAKSNKVLSKSTIASARKVLNRDNGRCTPDSLLFVANRLLESADEDDVALGRAIRDEVGCNSLRPGRIDHMLFTVSGNAPPAALKEDLEAAGTERDQYVANLRIEDHQQFIAEMYEEVLKLGDE